MGQGASTQINDQNLPIIKRKIQIVLDKDQNSVGGLEFKSQIRKIKQQTLMSLQNSRNLKTQNDINNSIKLASYLQIKNQQQQSVDYWKIFSQLLQGIYQLHRINLLARCLTLDKIYKKHEMIYFDQQGYFQSLTISPEFIMKKMPTFETDLWQVGAIMFEILTGEKIEQYLPQQFNEINVLEFQSKIGIALINITIQISQDQKLLTKEILKVSAFSRPSLVDVFKKKQIQEYIPQESYQKIIKFYSYYQIKGLLKQWKYSKESDENNKVNQNIYFYYIRQDIIKYFYQDYLEIQLLNFIFHFSLHYPCSFDQQLLINQIIIQKMWIKSRSLKLKMLANVHRIVQEFELILNDEEQNQLQQELQVLKKQIDYQHSILYYLKLQFFQEEGTLDVDNQIQNLKYQTPKTLTQKLSINILRNSSIKQYSMEKFNSLSLEEMFEEEIRQRI